MEPKVSVIIPVYNTQKYLAKCIESCVSQTLDGIEIIVINDGSTDASLEIAEHYAAEYDNVRVKSIENSGLSIARNTGLEMATGKYVYFLDSDDWIDLDCLEKCYALAERNILEIVTFDARTIQEGQYVEEILTRQEIVDGSKVYTGREFMHQYGEASNRSFGGILVQAWTYFVRRDYLIANQISFLPNAIYEDNKYYMDLLIPCKRMMYLPESLYNRVCRNYSLMTTSFSERKLLSVYEIVFGVLESIEKARISEEERFFWLKHYICYRMGIVTGLVGVNKKILEPILSRCYSKLEEIQYECLKKCYNIMIKMSFSMEGQWILLLFAETLLRGIGVISPRQKALLNAEEDKQRYIYECLKELPFSEAGKKIGIYGVGNHTRVLLDQYKKLIGEIKCDLICLDSNKESYTETFEGCYSIVNIRDVSELGLDGIAISSFLYENELYSLACVAAGPEMPIYKIYENRKEPIDLNTDDFTQRWNQLLFYRESYEEKRVILVGTPWHTNTGDYLISYAEKKFFEKYFPDYKVIEIPASKFWNNPNNIWATISVMDIICITGGGFFGSHWFEGDMLRQALEAFPVNQTIVLPQSLYYENCEEGNNKAKKVQSVVANHKSLTICYREVLSLSRGQAMFGEKVAQHLFPDMALLLNGLERKGERHGIKLCLRTDVESVLTQEQRQRIAEATRSMSELATETSMHWHHVIELTDAERIINEKLDELGSAELVITDALHCMISCALVGTPCIALPNVTGKVGGVYAWVEELPYIRYVENTENIAEAMKEMFRNPDFKECKYDLRFAEYEQRLKEIILQGS